MRAWQLDRLGGHLKLIEAPIPDARPGTVVLRLEASVLMSFMYPTDGYRRLFELVRAGLLDLTAITPHSYPLADLPAAMAAAATVGSLGCVVMTP